MRKEEEKRKNEKKETKKRERWVYFPAHAYVIIIRL